MGDDGTIVDVGPENELRRAFPEAAIEEVEGVLFPGFIDCHTHAVFGAARLADHQRGCPKYCVGVTDAPE